MPGTIQVSVLDFKNILSSSPPSLWVSMGKRAFQTWDKGDFSFPLTTFRENLIVRLEDAEGNEVSRTEVQTLLIVEKGHWDDLFQVEGGYVHMKLQFILSEDDRNRIRNVRESALKKKQDKVPASNVVYPGTAITMQDKIASPMPIKKDFSDRREATSSSPVKEGVDIQHSEPYRPSANKLQSQLIGDYISVQPVYEQDARYMLKMDVAGMKESLSLKKIVDPSNKPEDQAAQSMLKMDAAAKKESVSPKKIVDPSYKPEDQNAQSVVTMDVAEKNEAVPHKKIVDPSYKPEEQGAQSILKMDVAAKKESVSQKKAVGSPEEQGVLERTPSSVRKMISAFETGLAQKKGRRSLTRTRASKSQPNLVGIDLEPEDSSSPNKMSGLRLEEPLNTGNLPETQRNIAKRGESRFSEQDIVGTGQPVFHEQLKQSSALSVPLNDAGSGQYEMLRSVKKESNTGATSPVDLMRLSNPETATNSQRINVAYSDIQEADILATDQDRSDDLSSVAEKRNSGNRSETLPEFHFQRASTEKPKSIAYRKNELYEPENSGVLKESSGNIVPFNGGGSSQQETLKSTKKESNAGATSPVDLMRLSDLERLAGSQRIIVAHSDIMIANNLAADQDCSNNPSVASSETSPEIHFESASKEKSKSIAYCDNEHYDVENSGVWIFPDNQKDLCMTTAGKDIVHLMEDCHIGVDDHKRKKGPSMQEITGKRVFFDRSDSMIKKEREKPLKPTKSQPENSRKNGSSGPVRQVIKIAVILGFGIFVLLTRQKENRRGDRKPKDSFVSSPDFMDQLTSSEEQWSLLTADGD